MADQGQDKETAHKTPLNQIFYGPPGTGKTYHVIEAAVEICDPEFFKANKNERDGLKKRYDELVDAKRISFVTFHQSYGYEEFIEGLKAETTDGQISYKIKEGIFKDICRRAKEDSNLHYVLIIDEINRGNISKIFGELITLIEDSKRKGEKEALSLTLPYSDSGEVFSVPGNLYLIGTMNTADRSLTMIDTALRRRFEFVEMMPDPEKLNEKKNIEGVDLKELLTIMNQRIEVLYDREHMLGHAFFINIETLEALKAVFQNKIIPLLQEYFFEDWEKIHLVLGRNGFVSEDKIDKNNLFGGAEINALPEKIYRLLPEKHEAWNKSENYKKIYEKSVKEEKTPQDQETAGNAQN